MKRTPAKQVLAALLCIVMVLGLFPDTALAVQTNGENAQFVSETHDVFKHTESTLAPGVEQYIDYAYAKDGKQMVYYVATADITRDDVVVQTSYLKQHENGIMGMEKLTNQIAYANEKYSDPDDAQYISEYYNVVAGVNASFYNMTTGQPMGITYIDGVSFGTTSYDNFFAVLKDGKTAVVDYAKNLSSYVDENGESTIWQAVAGSQWLVRDGKDVTAGVSGDYNTQRHSRTCVGVTADGKVVTMVLDGRQEPFSCGGSMHELAQIMLEAGCVAAINLDGGGSTTYAARPEGSDAVSVINRPSDGSERSISAGLIIASTAAPSNVFDRMTMTAADEYVTPGTGTEITVSGVSPAGTSAEIPEGVTYAVSNGTYENGILTPAAVGDTVLTARYEGRDVGSVTVHAVMPEKLAFVNASMTVPFGKTVTLNLTATYGLNEVKIKAQDVNFTLGNPGVGTIDGFDFTAGDGSVTESAITAAIIGTDVTAAAQIKLGKGSEVLWDFEDGDISEFYRTAAANYNYLITPGSCSLVTAETGKVHSGSYALKFNADFSVATESGYMNARLNVKNNTGERIDLKDATRLGMWIYFPIEAKSLNGRVFLQEVTERNEDGSIKTVSSKYTTATLIDDGGDWDCGFTMEYDEPGWHYVYFNLSGGDWCIPANWTMLDMYVNDRDGSKHGYNHLEHKSQNSNVVMYLDDITVDYSDAVDDRDAPVFSSLRWADSKMSDAASFTRGTVAQTNDNVLSFSAAVADKDKSNATGLDEATARIYVDGVAVPSTLQGGVLSTGDCVLADGIHTVKFAVCDKQGNYASAIRQINVQAGSGLSTVKLVPHDASVNNILLGSVYYMDLVATDVEKVQSMSADIDLNNMSRWELDHMTVAPGFEASYVISDPDEKIATVTITRTGSTDATGEGVLVSMPVRTWELPAVVADGTRTNVWMYPEYRKGNEVWPIDISISVVRGEVTFIDGTADTFTGAGVQVDTEAHYWTNETKPADYASWNGGHDHRAETKQYYAETATNHVDAQPLPDKAATCTEDGYTGRTYCQVCSSVVEWGAAVPAPGHSYELTDGVVKCSVCGQLFTGERGGKYYVDGVLANGWYGDSYYTDGAALTGVQLVDGFYYDFGEDGVCPGRAKYTGFISDETGLRYAKIGVLSSGWNNVDGDVYYFDPANFYAIKDGRHGIDGVPYDFQDYKLYNGYWVRSAKDGHLEFYWAGRKLCNTWFTLRGQTYHFDANCRAATGTMLVKLSTGGESQMFVFDEAGVLQYAVESTGIYRVGGKAYYLVDGIAKIGLWEENGEYYYFCSSYTMTTGRRYVDKNAAHDIVEPGYYEFGSDGAMLDREFAAPQGQMIYYVMGQPYFAGAVRIDDKIYYAGENGVMATGRCYVEKTNGLLDEGTYEFGADGVLIGPADVTVVASGACGENAAWTLYDSGKLVIGGSGAVQDYKSQLVTPWVSYRDSIKAIEIGAEITSIGRYAFSHLYEVKSIVFAEGSKLEKIDVTGFYYDFHVTSVVLPETVTSLGTLAFGRMYELKELYVPQGVNSIADNAFQGFRNLTLNVAAGTYAETYAKENGIPYVTR